jgi:hypothetical protein
MTLFLRRQIRKLFDKDCALRALYCINKMETQPAAFCLVAGSDGALAGLRRMR